MTKIISGIENWYWKRIISEANYMPAINPKAKYVFYCILFNVILFVVLAQEEKNELLIYLFLQIVVLPSFIIFLIYLWLKYGVAYFRGYIVKNNDPIFYYINVGILVVAYLAVSTLDLWLELL